jgi:hypothetical protein
MTLTLEMLAIAGDDGYIAEPISSQIAAAH